MGRYYSGDIEGKFWFAVQSSDDASFFGGEESEPQVINYEFEQEHKKEVEKGIAECINKLGKYKNKLDEFFNKHDGYNDEMIVKEFEIPEKKVRELLEWYARLELGEKILKCIKEKGSCYFEAEL